MKQKNLILFAGIPASGKSFWAKHNLTDNDLYISRDEIRFSLLQEGEAYFAHEDDVCRIMWTQINESLAANKNTYVDEAEFYVKDRADYYY